MAKRVRFVVLGKKHLILAAIGALVCIAAIIIAAGALARSKSIPVSGNGGDYVILAENDLGMHCYQEDYSGFLILPPANNLKVQVFKKGEDSARLINSGIEVSYEIINNTVSVGKTNFWDYAKDYGYNVAPNIGITGNGLKGTLELSPDKAYYIATAIPVTPYNDGSTKRSPLQMARVTVKDIQTGKVLAEADNVVIPVSEEMECSMCHGGENTDLNILNAHDRLSGTSLTADIKNGKRHKCSECHADNILEAKGVEGVPPLSEAMHDFHSAKMGGSSASPVCYSCHPGPETKCYRGRMYAAGVSCTDAKCHGDMANIAKTQTEGRRAWLDEPDCGACHGSEYSVNANTLYRNSYLMNSPSAEMNGIILCASCHNGTHAEWKSTQQKDNLFPKSLLGYESFIDKCSVCHRGRGKMHNKSG